MRGTSARCWAPSTSRGSAAGPRDPVRDPSSAPLTKSRSPGSGSRRRLRAAVAAGRVEGVAAGAGDPLDRCLPASYRRPNANDTPTP